MNTKEYIDSGIIESCMLGLATKTEYQEFIELCSRHPEIVAARNAIELALEEQLMKETIPPPAHLKEEIFRVVDIPATNGAQRKKKAPLLPVRRVNIWKSLAAACIIFVIGISYWAYTVNEKYQQMLAETVKTANRPDHSSHVEAVSAFKNIVQKPSIKWSTMVEPANEGHCMAHIYWDSLSKNTFLLLGDIPKLFSDKQFQLWGMKGNLPVNLGIFDAREEGRLIQMKNNNSAQSFTITLEPKGGAPPHYECDLCKRRVLASCQS